mmetsp:Transcript_41042/g.113021  ORF Transcript_41042/g.113021 Transcript_41042/m.113021 type:complete len:799 (-) Transcript_41042:96-2492(-)
MGKADKELAAAAYAAGPLACGEPAQTFVVGRFQIAWSGEPELQLTISHMSAPKRPLWRNVSRASLFTSGRGSARVSESRGFFKFKEKLEFVMTSQVIDRFVVEEEGGLAIFGSYVDKKESEWRFRARAIDDVQLSLELTASVAGVSCNRLCLNGESAKEEEFFGFGTQFTHLGMKGRRVPVLSQEPGIGRGIQPLTGVMETLFGAGGAWWQSYAPSPMFASTELRSFCLENTEYSVFDLRPESSLRVGVYAEAFRGRLFFGEDPLKQLEAYTRFCGRMRRLPGWVGKGAIVGIQGGTDKVRRALAKLEAKRTPISALWLQDWVGRRKTAIGSQLWWSWELDRDRYPGWDDLLADLSKKGIRVLTYVNPFVVDASGKRALERNLYTEAKDGGFFIRAPSGEPYAIQNTTFEASMLDLTNPGCRQFLKAIIKDNVIGAGASGWMADYAEALPFDAVLHGQQDAAQYHNEYPIEWARLNREVIVEAGLEDDVLFFTRSGYHTSPGSTTCFWLGDQLTSWRQEDGIKSVVTGLVSSGLSGFSLNHGDVGGYTCTYILPVYIPGVSYNRGKELLLRWIELSAFTAIFRSHEGSKPAKNHQITDDPETISQFARFARIYGALAEYRAQLCEEAAERGLPLVRHPWLHYPSDPQVRNLKHQFMLGPDFMIAPVLDKGSDTVRLYLPQGSWVHLWSGATLDLEARGGGWLKCHAPIGAPPVFYTEDSAAGRAVAGILAAAGDLNPGTDNSVWSVPPLDAKREDPTADDAPLMIKRQPQSQKQRRSFLGCSCRSRRLSRVDNFTPKE